MRYLFLILPMLVLSAGCVVTQRQDTPVRYRRLVEKQTQREYYIYVPSNYDAARSWPLVVTLHGAGVWDSGKSQIREWRYLAEQKGLIVVAPELDSAAYCVLRRGAWMKDLASDERAVLAIMDEVAGKYNVAAGSVLLTGFLEGGYPLYYVGLRNAGRFSMLIARDCYCDLDMMRGLELNDGQWKAAKELSMMVFNGKDGWGLLSGQGWKAFRFLRKNRCFNVEHKELRGGQLRRPNKAYKYWSNGK